MKARAFQKAKFLTSAVNKAGCPSVKDHSGTLLPEIAVFGRSNVGKSSLLNHLFNQRQLVKTSSTPGKTQVLNFFAVDEKVLFVDLPGYGYAEVSQKVRRRWGPMVREYIDQRQQLKLILFLFDVRRTPTAEDREFLQFFCKNQKQVILILTKVDKLTSGELVRQRRAIAAGFATADIPIICYSVLKNIGARELTHQIYSALCSSLGKKMSQRNDVSPESDDDSSAERGEGGRCLNVQCRDGQHRGKVDVSQNDHNTLLRDNR